MVTLVAAASSETIAEVTSDLPITPAESNGSAVGTENANLDGDKFADKFTDDKGRHQRDRRSRHIITHSGM